MAGCFGNHPFDRAMERDLYRHLDKEVDYETMCEMICEKIPDDLWDEYDDYCNKMIDKYRASRIERGIMTMEEAQNLLLRLVEATDAVKKYVK
jgi:hypothetical protein